MHPGTDFRRLYDFQERTVEWMTEREREAATGIACGLVLSASGLGKTISTLALVQRSPGPSLIVTRPALLDQWLRLCTSWFPEVKVYTYHGQKRKDGSRFPGAMDDAHVVLTTNRTLLSDAHFQRRRTRHLDNCKSNGGMASSLQQGYLSYLASLRPRDIQPVKETHWKRIVYDDVHRNMLAVPLNASFRWGISNREPEQLPGHVWSLVDPASMCRDDDRHRHCLRFTWNDVPQAARPVDAHQSVIHFDLSIEDRAILRNARKADPFLRMGTFRMGFLHPTATLLSTTEAIRLADIDRFLSEHAVVHHADAMAMGVVAELQAGAFKCPISLHTCTMDGVNPPILLGCGHCICVRCVSRMDACPFCRTSFDGLSRVRLAHTAASVATPTETLELRLRVDAPRMQTASALIHMWLSGNGNDVRLMVIGDSGSALRHLQSCLDSLCIASSLLLGSSSPTRRFAVIRNFSAGVLSDKPSGKDVLLTTPNGVCLGLNVQCVTHVLILQPNFDHPLLMDTVHQHVTRLGRSHPVVICTLVAMDTIEEEMVMPSGMETFLP